MKTIKQIAEEIGVSKTAVRKKLTEDIRNQFSETIGNTVYISKQGEALIKTAFSNKDGNQVSENQTETVSALVSMLKSELEVKNRQIERLQAENEIKNKQIDFLQTAFTNQQLLHGGTIQQQLIGGEAPTVRADDVERENPNPKNPHKKPTFLNGIFRKRKGKTNNV